MPRISPITLVNRPERAVLVVRDIIAERDLPSFTARSYAAISAYLQALGEYPSDTPYVCFYNENKQALQVSAGFYVPWELPGTDLIQSVVLPPTKFVICMYQGPCGPLQAPVYEELANWIFDHELDPLGPITEQYYNDNEFPDELLLTKMMVQVK